MKRIEDIADRYSKALESIKDIRSELTDAVVKYLLINSSQFKKCTQLAISEHLGIPQSTIRRLLIELEEEWVLKSREVGQAKPYEVSQLGYAMDRGYVSFDKQEVIEVLRPREYAEEKPKPRSISASFMIGDRRGGKMVTRYLTPGGAAAADVFVGRLMGFLPESPIDKALKKAFTEEKTKNLRFMFPEYGLFSQIFSGPEWPWRMSFRPFRPGKEPNPEGIRKSIQNEFEGRRAEVHSKLSILAQMFEKDGYRGMLNKEPVYKYHWYSRGSDYPTDYRFRKEYVYGTTYSVRRGLDIGKELEIDKDNIEETRNLALALDMAMDEEYPGLEKGGPLLEWAREKERR